jgi:hypothetical protein
MLRPWIDRLQALWVQNTRNRIIIMVSTVVVAILLLCGCLNVLGAIGGGLVDSLLASGPPVRPTLQTGTQVANINPTFPLPTPTVYGFPNQPGQQVPASNTPPPTPTPSPTPTEGPTPPGGGLNYHIRPDPNAFTSGQTNRIDLDGQPGTIVGVSIFFQGYNGCVQGVAPGDPVVLDGSGHGVFSCDVPANLKGTTAGLQIQPINGPPIVQQGIPVS